MDPSTQFLYDYVIWQWPIRWIVTLAFYAFAFKLTAGVLRHVLRGLIGFKRWAITAERSLSPEHPMTWPIMQWVDKTAGTDTRISTMTQSILWSFYQWLSPPPAIVTTHMSQNDRAAVTGRRGVPWISS